MILRLFLRSEFWHFEGNFAPRIRVALKVRLFYAIRRVKGSKKMTMQSKKEIQNQAQEGRSMVEMLGVLAIIAVVSIGGIVGYKLAMNHYQANQIAHEMNIMRTDAQIKIAQGTEKLILGEPYDSINESTLGHIQFNDDYPIDFACALADEDTIELSNISCHVANAYYIELQNIPEGVCKPLAELLNGMSNVIAFNVNKNEYPDKGNCEAGNENVLNAVFSAEAVSELKVCAEDTDCESESAPHCDPSRHVCVSCYEDNQCAHNQYCEDNTCVTCESGVWNGEECVECTDNDDCADTPDTPVCNTAEYKCVECLTYENCIDKTGTPQCDEASHTCKSCIDIDLSKPVWADTQCVECIESTDCSDELVCKENTCSPCETEDECQVKGTTYHCSKDKTCIQCLDNQVWGGQDKGCVECMADNDCTDTPDTPKCNTTTNQCVQCLADSDCKNPTPICSEENTCVSCKTNEECRLKNPSEENCTKNGACCEDPLMTWNGSECVCPADYVKSPTSSGKTVCLPYCKDEDNIGVILMTDTSSSVTEAEFENANKAKEALNIPEHINSAVYWCGKCYSNNCFSATPSSIPNKQLSYGKHSVSEIQSHLQTKLSDKLTVASDFGGGIDDIISYCKNIKEKLFIIVWWDYKGPDYIGSDLHGGIGDDLKSFGKLKTECPGVIFYSVSPNAASFPHADKNFDLNKATPDYVEVLNKVLKERSCIERK